MKGFIPGSSELLPGFYLSLSHTKTNMSTKEENYLLIRRTLEALIENPRDLVIDFKELPGRVDWIVNTHIEDQPLVIGQGGTHIKALELLVWELGERIDTDYHFRLMSPARPARRADRAKKEAKEYDATEARELLNDWLYVLLDERPKLDCAAMLIPPLRYTFIVQAINRADHEKLLVAQTDKFPDRIIAPALGTLFRAYGLRDGVNFTIEVPE